MSLGVAFSGGGLKGVAYIGAIKALKELEVPINYLSGTSSGSIFASLYAMNYSLEEMKSQVKKYYNIFTKINNKNILKAGISYFIKGNAEIEGLILGENIEKILKKIFKEKSINNINEIDLPCAIIAVDAITSRECVFSSKTVNVRNEEKDYITDIPLATAIRASMSFPGIFTPCSYGDYYLIDGGTRNNLPVDVLRDMGAEKILALNFKLDEFSAKSDIFSILLRSSDIFSINNIENARKKADLAIEIDVSSASLLKIEDIDEAIEAGYNTIMNNKNKILELLK